MFIRYGTVRYNLQHQTKRKQVAEITRKKRAITVNFSTAITRSGGVTPTSTAVLTLPKKHWTM